MKMGASLFLIALSTQLDGTASGLARSSEAEAIRTISVLTAQIRIFIHRKRFWVNQIVAAAATATFSQTRARTRTPLKYTSLPCPLDVCHLLLPSRIK